MREVHAKLDKTALRATMEGHAITIYVVPSHARHWLSQHFIEHSIPIEGGTGS